MRLQGRTKVDSITKKLVNYLCQEDIAVIYHDDIDEMASNALIQTGVKAIINTGRTMTGRFKSEGALTLIHNNMTIIDVCLPLNCFKDNDAITIMDNDIKINNYIYKDVCTIVNRDYIKQRQQEAELNKNDEIIKFIDNTMEYIEKEKKRLICFSNYPSLDTRIEGRHAIIVVRNNSSLEDLILLRNYIERYNPIFIGVDGGADMIVNCGYTPDILIGDMDSVSDIGIYKSREIVLHAYENGYCPCKKRIAAMNVPYKILGITGTSEDAALMLAYHKEAELIVLVGGHSCMHDFICKGRPGMASTFIARTLIGSKLVDCKGLGVIAASESEGKGLNWAKM